MIIIILILMMIANIFIGKAIGCHKTYKKVVETAILAQAKDNTFTINHQDKTVELQVLDIKVERD